MPLLTDRDLEAVAAFTSRPLGVQEEFARGPATAGERALATVQRGIGGSVNSLTEVFSGKTLFGAGGTGIFGMDARLDPRTNPNFDPSFLEQVGEEVTSLVTDPLFFVAGAGAGARGLRLAQRASRAGFSGAEGTAARVFKRFVDRGFTEPVAEDLTRRTLDRLVARSTARKTAGRIAETAGTLGAFSGASSAAQQFADVFQGRREHLNLTEVAQSTAGGAFTGAVLGAIGGTIDPIARQIVATMKGATGKPIAKTVGEAVKIGAEITGFAGADAALRGEFPSQDDFAHAAGIVLGLKAVHLPFNLSKNAEEKRIEQRDTVSGLGEVIRSGKANSFREAMEQVFREEAQIERELAQEINNQEIIRRAFDVFEAQAQGISPESQAINRSVAAAREAGAPRPQLAAPPAEPSRSTPRRPEPFESAINPPREEVVGGFQFVSPSIREDLTFEQARAASTSSEQGRFRSLFRDIDAGIRRAVGVKREKEKTADISGIGDWIDGAENTIITEYNKNVSVEELRYSTALKSRAANQKQGLWFKRRKDKSGKNVLYRVKVSGDIESVRESLNELGVQFKTVAPVKGGSVVYVFGEKSDNSTAEKIAKFGELNNVKTETFFGEGGFIGSESSRAEAIRDYNRVIDEFEAANPGARRRRVDNTVRAAGFKQAGVARKLPTDLDYPPPAEIAKALFGSANRSPEQVARAVASAKKFAASRVAEFPIEKRAKKLLPEFTSLLAEVATEVNSKHSPLANTKTHSSILGKLRRHALRGRLSTPDQLGDVLRGAIRVNSVGDFRRAFEEIAKRFTVTEQSLGFAKPMNENAFGYRGFHIDVEMPGGLRAEIQVHTEKTWRAKQIGDKTYDKWRDKTLRQVMARLNEFAADMRESFGQFTRVWSSELRDAFGQVFGPGTADLESSINAIARSSGIGPAAIRSDANTRSPIDASSGNQPPVATSITPSPPNRPLSKKAPSGVKKKSAIVPSPSVGNIVKTETKVNANLDKAVKRVEAELAKIKKDKSVTLPSGGFDPKTFTQLGLHVQLGALKMAIVGRDFAKWSAEMVKEFGDKIKPYLRPIFEESKRINLDRKNRQELEDAAAHIENQVLPKAPKTGLRTASGARFSFKTKSTTDRLGSFNRRNMNLDERSERLFREAIDRLTNTNSIKTQVLKLKSVDELAKLSGGLQLRDVKSEKEIEAVAARAQSSKNFIQFVNDAINELSKQPDSQTKRDEMARLMGDLVEEMALVGQYATGAGKTLKALDIQSKTGFGRDIKISDFRNEVIRELHSRLLEVGKSTDDLVKKALEVKDWGNVNEVGRLYREFTVPTVSQLLREFRLINILSSPKTQLINIGGNFIQSAILRPSVIFTEGVIDYAAGLMGMKKTGRRPFKDTAEYLRASRKSLREARRAFRDSWKGKMPRRVNLNGEEVISLRPDIEHFSVFDGKAWNMFRTPLRALEAADQFFMAVNYGGERAVFESRQQAGAKTTAFEDPATLSKYNVFRAALDTDGKVTGQGHFLRAVDKMSAAFALNLRRLGFAIPGLAGKRIKIGGRSFSVGEKLRPFHWVIPFVLTPMNILKMGLEFNPITGLMTIPGSATKRTQLAKAIVGSVAMGIGWSFAASDEATWAGPKGGEDKKFFFASGRKPYSLKIGKNWVPYQRIGPLAYPIAIAAAFKERWNDNPADAALTNMIQVSTSMAGFFTDQSYMEGIGSLIDTIEGRESAFNRFAANLVRQTIPWTSFQSWVTRMVDGVYRKPSPMSEDFVRGLIEELARNTPGFSHNLSPYTNPQGEPSTRPLPILNAINPFGEISPSDAKADAVLVNRQKNKKITRGQNRITKLRRRRVAGEISQSEFESGVKDIRKRIEEFRRAG